MKDDKWVKRWLVIGSKEYTVAQDADGNWACNCLGWTRHVPRTDCKHIKEVKAGGGMPIEDVVMARLSGKLQRTYRKSHISG